jgi:hypothetical protein
MSTVSFKRSANVNEIPIVDGQLVFDETHNKIYMDNGTERLQYGGDVSLIEDVSYATSNNTFSANGSLDIFTQKLSVIDNKDSALAVTEQHVPVGCLAFQSTIGNADYSGIGNTISDSLVTLKNNINSVNGQLTANNNNIYMDYHDGKYGVNTSSTRGADTFIPFKGIPEESNGQILYNARSYGRGGSGHSYGVSGSITIQKAGIVSICGLAQAAYSSAGSVTLNGVSIFNSSGAYANPVCSLIKSVSVGDVIVFSFMGYGSGSEGYEVCGGSCAITLFSMD